MSITHCAVAGAATLMAEISVAAPARRPCRSARRSRSTCSRSCSSRIRQSAIVSWTTPCSASGLPNATRSSDALAHQVERPLGHPDQPHAVVDAPRAQPGLGQREAASALAEQRLGTHAHVVERHLGVPAVGLVPEPEHRQAALDLHARGVARHQQDRVPLVARRRRAR